MTAAARSEEKEFHLGDREFEHLRRLVTRATGIVLSDSKREMVYSRVSRRLRALDLESFRQYCLYLEEHLDTEMGELINAITTNLTAFFREPHHFEYLRKTALPEIVKKNADTRRLRIWSAGCSTGEEPYSIAMTLAESMPRGWDCRILASDLDTEVLAKAERGVYTLERAEGLGAQRLQRWFQRGRGAREGMVQVSADLRAMIAFKRINLIEEWPMSNPFDVIFCRNVVIYFDKDTQRKIFDGYANLMREHAPLFIGHSESLFRITERFELVGQTIYRKKG